jgi:hypothetical protein
MRRVSAATEVLDMEAPRCDGTCGCLGCADCVDAGVGPVMCGECGHMVAEEGAMPNGAEKVAATRKPRARKRSAGPSPEDKGMAEKLLAAPTFPDKAWAPARGAVRNAGESRLEFIRRVLLSEAS